MLNKIINKGMTSIPLISNIKSFLFYDSPSVSRAFSTLVGNIQQSGQIISINSYFDKKKQCYVCIVGYLINSKQVSLSVPSSYSLDSNSFNSEYVFQSGANFNKFYLNDSMLEEFKKVKSLPCPCDFTMRLGTFGANASLIVESFEVIKGK